MSYTLEYASPSDITDLVAAFALALSNDRVTKLKSAYHSDDANYTGSLIETPLKSWLDRPERYRVLKVALCDPSGATIENPIAGWICWGFHGLKESEINRVCDAVNPSEILSGSVRTVSNKPSSRDSTQPAPVDNMLSASPKYSVDELEAQCSASTQKWISRLTPDGEDEKCMFICSLCVQPNMQGRGIGSALLEWGTRIADVEQLSAWVHSSEDGSKAFANQGFREVGRLELLLSRYTQDENLRPAVPYI